MNSPEPELTPDDRKLERELRGLEPEGPSDGLKARIRAAAADLGVETTPESRKVIAFPQFLKEQWLGAAAACFALVFAILLLADRQPADTTLALGNPDTTETEVLTGDSDQGLILWGNDNVPRIDQNSFVSQDQVLISQENFGIVQEGDGPPMWKIQCEIVNRAVWEDQETGDRHEKIVPERRILFVPVRHD